MLKMKISDLTLIVYYPVCAGGKFIINSLGLSRHCTLHDYQLGIWDSDQTVYDQTYYQTKLEHTLCTVPPNKQDLNWREYEMGNSHQLSNPYNFTLHATNITKQQQYFCIIAHDIVNLERIKYFTKSTNVIKLTNFAKWARNSSFKHQDISNNVENYIYHRHSIDKEEMQGSTWFHTIDIDCGMQDQSVMQYQIQSLYTKLGWNDFDQTSWTHYYQRYIQSHNLLL